MNPTGEVSLASSVAPTSGGTVGLGWGSAAEPAASRRTATVRTTGTMALSNVMDRAHPASPTVFAIHSRPMGSIAFTRNYTDHSNDTGYQFEFHCDKCGNGYRSTFHASALGVGAKLAKGLGSLFGGGQLWAAGQA